MQQGTAVCRQFNHQITMRCVGSILYLVPDDFDGLLFGAAFFRAVAGHLSDRDCVHYGAALLSAFFSTAFMWG